MAAAATTPAIHPHPARAFPTALSSSDDVMLRIEADPVLRSSVVVVGALDRAPDQDRLRVALDGAIARVPRLRQRVVDLPPWQRGRQWVDDPTFSVAHHIRRLRVPEPGTLREVLDLAGAEMTSPFDPVRPPWSCTIVEGLGEGRAAFLLRFHHTITDGVGGIELTRDLFDAGRGGTARGPAAQPAREGSPGPGVVARSASALAGVAKAVVSPRSTAVAGLRIARSATRLLKPSGEPLSPLLVDRGTDRHLSVVDVPLADLRRSATAVGGTVNDVFLAAVGGALHDYHERSGSAVGSLRFTMPVSLRRPDDPPGGNRFVPVRFTLPVDDPDPEVRARLAGAVSRRWRREPAVPLSAGIASFLDWLPTPVLVKVFGSLLRSNDVDIVDVPGPERVMFLAGARIDRMWAFAPPVGAAISTTLLSYAGTCGIGLACDLAAVADPRSLHDCLDRGIAQVVEIGHPPHREARA